MNIMTAERSNRWEEMDDWGADDWERWELESQAPELRFDPEETLGNRFDDDGFDGELVFEH